MQQRDQISAPVQEASSSGGLSLKRAARALGRASWAVIDQALLGLANFAVNLGLARWFTPAEYGAYVAASSVFWVTMTVHSGLLSEPLIVFGSGRFRDRHSSYFAALVLLHCCLSALIAGALATAGGVAMFWGSKASGASMLGYAFAAPIILLLQLFRRTLYIEATPRSAACASAAYMLGMLALIYALYRGAALSAFTAPIAAAGASVPAIVGIVAIRGYRLWPRRNGAFMREIAGAHWRYGRWAVVTEIVAWVPGSLYFVILPLSAGLDATGALNALIMLVMPAAQAYIAVNLLLVPTFGRMRQSGSADALLWKVLMILALGATLYALLVAFFGRPAMDLLYRGRYTEYTQFTWLVGLIVLPMAAIAALGSALRARERPDRVLRAYLISAAVAFTFGVAAVAVWGLLGAILGMLAGYVTTACGLLWWVLRSNPRAEPQMATTLPV